MRQEDIKVGDDLFYSTSNNYMGYGGGRRVRVIGKEFKTVGPSWSRQYEQAPSGKLIKVQQLTDTGELPRRNGEPAEIFAYVRAQGLRGPWEEVSARRLAHRNEAQEASAREAAERNSRFARCEVVIKLIKELTGDETAQGDSWAAHGMVVSLGTMELLVALAQGDGSKPS